MGGRRACTKPALSPRGLESQSPQLLDQVEGANEGVGGVSVAYIHRKLTAGVSAVDALTAHAKALGARIAHLESELAERDAALEAAEK